MKNRILIIFTIFVIVASLTGCSGGTPVAQPPKPAQQEAAPQNEPVQPEAQTKPESTQPEAAAPAVTLDGKALVAERCTKCHGLDRIEAKKSNAEGWKSTVERMIGKGAQLSDAEKQAVIDYLAKTFPE